MARPKKHIQNRLAVPGVYTIANTKNGKVYVGSSKNVFIRWVCHRSEFKRGKNSVHLQRAWNKYGDKAFVYKLVKLCKVRELVYWENHYIQLFRSAEKNFGYNIQKTSGFVPERLPPASRPCKKHRVMMEGRDMTVKEICSTFKMKPATFLCRIRNGYTVDEAITVPLHKNKAKSRQKDERFNYKGEDYTVMQLAKMSGIKDGTLRARLGIGWTVEKALATPVTYRKIYQYKGMSMDRREIAEKYNISQHVLKRRLQLGWTVEKAITTPARKRRHRKKKAASLNTA